MVARRAGPVRWAMWLMVVLLAACAGPSSAGGVDREEHVAVDGASLYMLVRGDDPRAPVLIWLHGGPGGAERPLFRLYDSGLERHFVVAYLDQRGAGRSYDPAAPLQRLTIAQHLADLDRVVDQLRAEQGRPKVILVGHSWGSALGLLYAKAHPDKVQAFVGVGQVSTELGRERAQYEFVQDEATKRGDAKALATLAEIGPPPFSSERELRTQRLVEKYGGYWRDQPNLLLLMARGLAEGIVQPGEVERIFKGNSASLQAMNDELLKLDLTTQVQELDVPVAFFLGRHDRQVDSRLAAAYFETLKAPAKRLVWFDTAHNVPFEAPAAFEAAVLQTLTELRALDGEARP